MRSVLTGVPDDNDDPGGDVIGAKDRDSAVVGVGDRELPLADVQQRDGANNLKQIETVTRNTGAN